MKCELDLYEYVRLHTSMYWVRTYYILVCSMYCVYNILQRLQIYIVCLWEMILCVVCMQIKYMLVNWYIPVCTEYVLSTYWYVLYLQKYDCRGCCFM